MPSSSTGTMRIKRLKKIKKRLEALCLSGHRNLISGKRIREAIKIVYVHFGKAGRVREREREREREGGGRARSREGKSSYGNVIGECRSSRNLHIYNVHMPVYDIAIAHRDQPTESVSFRGPRER